MRAIRVIRYIAGQDYFDMLGERTTAEQREAFAEACRERVREALHAEFPKAGISLNFSGRALESSLRLTLADGEELHSRSDGTEIEMELVEQIIGDAVLAACEATED